MFLQPEPEKDEFAEIVKKAGTLGGMEPIRPRAESKEHGVGTGKGGNSMAEKNNLKNRLIDLNNHLFEQMERLNDDDLQEEGLQQEIQRAKAMSFVASQIIGNARLALDAQRTVNDGMIKHPPKMLGIPGYGDAEE